MSDKVMETLLPDVIPVKIDGRDYSVGKLTAIQIIRLTRELIKVVVKMSEQDKSKLTSGNTNIDDILTFFGFLEEQQLTRVIEIVLKEKDVRLEGDILIEDLMNIVNAFLDSNDIGKIWGNVQQVAKKVKSQTQKARLLPASK